MRLAKPIELGIHEISKSEYLKECDKGLETLAHVCMDDDDPAKITKDTFLICHMCKPGEDETYISYTVLNGMYIFTRGQPWIVTPVVWVK